MTLRFQTAKWLALLGFISSLLMLLPQAPITIYAQNDFYKTQLQGEGKTVKENHLISALQLCWSIRKLTYCIFVKYTPRPFARDFDSNKSGVGTAGVYILARAGNETDTQDVKH